MHSDCLILITDFEDRDIKNGPGQDVEDQVPSLDWLNQYRKAKTKSFDSIWYNKLSIIRRVLYITPKK